MKRTLTTRRSVPGKRTMARRRYLIASLALAATIAALAATSAGAAVPQQTVVNIDDTFTATGICSFPIVEHVKGTARIIDFVDRNGNVVRELDLTPGLTVSFSANGTTLTTVSVSVAHITFNANGTATFTITGLSGHISIPGQGTLALDAGRIVAIFSDNQPPQLVAVNGTFSFDFGLAPPIEAQLCTALA
jgi:hypothetical protein